MKTSACLLMVFTALDAFVNERGADIAARPEAGGGAEVLRVREGRDAELQLKLDGKVEKNRKIVRLRNGRYVETALERREPLLILLVEYEDLLHNQIPEPDRSVDWMAPWEPTYDRAHYEE